MQIESLNQLDKFVEHTLKQEPNISKNKLLRLATHRFQILSSEIIHLKINKLFLSNSKDVSPANDAVQSP